MSETLVASLPYYRTQSVPPFNADCITGVRINRNYYLQNPGYSKLCSLPHTLQQHTKYGTAFKKLSQFSSFAYVCSRSGLVGVWGPNSVLLWPVWFIRNVWAEHCMFSTQLASRVSFFLRPIILPFVPQQFMCINTPHYHIFMILSFI